MWRVLIVEDDANMREFFAASVRRCDGLALAGSLGTVADARAWLDNSAHCLDVLLTDLGLPDGSGLEVIRHAIARNPACEALVISMFGDEENVLASIEAGALGYIHKDSTPQDIADAILQMKNGASPISPMIARRVLAKYRDVMSGASEHPGDRARKNRVEPQATPHSPGGRALSPREQEVLELIARGFSYADIARLKGVSVHTVQTHIKHLYGKLAVRSKNEAVYEATQLGLLQPPARV
ncbi:MAG TPA: response regulator transcription factor [Ramlibacter sp.]|jgi:DNA-binding NarL/FixJ family response regulator